MTDRIRQLAVTLDRDFRDDDLENIINAIGMIKNVEYVDLGSPVGMEDLSARRAAAQDIRNEILDVIFPGLSK